MKTKTAGSFVNKIGLAGEFRVMSELLLREHNPAKSYLEDGADIVLENDYRVEVKSSHKRGRKGGEAYFFTLKYKDFNKTDFLIAWCINDNVFYIIPANELRVKAGFRLNPTLNERGKYASYREKWGQLERE